MTAPAANPGTLARSRSAHGRRPGTRTSAVGKHHERIGKDVGRARIGPTDENWAGGVIPCDVVPVVREHANRHEGSEFASPSPQRWLGPGDRRRGTRIGPTTRPTPKSALLDARLHLLVGRVVVIAHTERGEGATRIISMRKANRREQEVYQERLGKG